MSDNTTIEWTDATWNPIRYRVKDDAGAIAERHGWTSLVQIGREMAGRVGQHCEHVSPGCVNCYSGTLQARRLPVNGTGLPFDRRSRDFVEPFLDRKVLLQPLRWKRGRRIFVINQSDLFGEWVPVEMIDLVFAVMALAGWHTFQVLTKRSKRLCTYLSDEDLTQRIEAFCPLPNVWLGVSVEDEQRADERIPDLLATPAAKRFLSVEPMLGPVGAWPGIDWVICGGESGRGARPMHPDWARSLRDQCVAADIPFFFKQWGEWGPFGQAAAGHENALVKCGKAKAGRLLDGVEWSQMP
jgi:protein gp37